MATHQHHNAKPIRRHWYDYDTGSAYLGITRRALQDAVTSGRCGHTRMGQKVLLSQEQLDRFLADCTVEPQR